MTAGGESRFGDPELTTSDMNTSFMITRRGILGVVVAATVLGCSSSTDLPTGANISVVEGSLRETASVRVDSGFVRTFVAADTLENLSNTLLPIVWGPDCLGNSPLDVRMYRGSTLVWESTQVPGSTGCPVRAIQNTLDSKQTFIFEWRATVKSILGDSLPPDAYTFTVRPLLSSPTLTRDVGAGQLHVADPVVVPPGTNLDGTWSGKTGGLSVSLALTWTADSVRGSGTYQFTPTTGAACYASTKASTGTVLFAARRIDDAVAGYFAFDFGYYPPYSGRLRSATQFDGVIMNVDTPGCGLVLTKGP